MTKLTYSEIETLMEERSDEDTDTLTEAVLKQADRDALRTIIKAFVAHEQREHARATERRAFAPIRRAFRAEASRSNGSAGQPAEHRESGGQWLQHFQQIRNERVALGDGQKRRWGAMTLEEHRTRIDMFREQIDGFERTISIHEQAIELIRENGVECLDDLVSSSSDAASITDPAGVAAG